MSLDNIQIPAVLVQDMYKRSLVDLDTNQQKTTSAKKAEWSFLGRNEKSVLLIVNEKDTAFLEDDDLKFLMGVLTACKLSMADVALVNFFKCPDLNYEGIGKQFKPDKIIFFGVEPTELDFPLQFPQYKLQQYNNQTYLCAPTLKTLAAQKDQKVLLWGCLKTLFSV